MSRATCDARLVFSTSKKIARRVDGSGRSGSGGSGRAGGGAGTVPVPDGAAARGPDRMPRAVDRLSIAWPLRLPDVPSALPAGTPAGISLMYRRCAQTVTALYIGVRQCEYRLSIPRTRFMYAVVTRWVIGPTPPSPSGKRSIDTIGVIS